MKRSRNRMKTLGIFAVVGSCLLSSSMGDEEEGHVEFSGDQYICQECAPPMRRRNVMVDSVSIVCDSSTDEYENSPTCKSGDQAKVAVSFTIRKMSESFDIYIDFNSRALGKRQRIYNNVNLCYLGNVVFWGKDAEYAGDDLYAQAKTTTCPLNNGPYTFFTAFTVPKYSNDLDLEFTPDIRVDFYSAKRELVGCVETGTLGRVAFSKGMEQRGRLIFVISFLAFCLVFAFCLMGHQRKRKQGERAIMKKQASLMRRFHYIQTTRSGDASNPSLTPSLSGSYSIGSDNLGRRAGSPPNIPATVGEVT